VVCRWFEAAIEIRAIYDGKPSPDEVEEMSIDETNVLADFRPSMTIQVLSIYLPCSPAVFLDASYHSWLKQHLAALDRHSRSSTARIFLPAL
jgi:hypothetical protein